MKLYLKYLLITSVIVLGFILTSSAAFGFAFASKNNACDTGIKGFINNILPRFIRFQFQCPKLGVATATGNFPQTYNNFQDNDIINAGDWGNIEYAIGTSTGTFSSTSVTSTIFYRLTNSNQLDPGHLHSSAGVSGTISIAKGGTATTTFDKGLVTASGTDAFDSLVVGGNNSIPMASGTNWVAGTITSTDGTVNITNNPGNMILSVPGANSFTFVTSTILTTNQTIITVTSTLARKFYKAYLFAGPLSQAGKIHMRLGDSSDNSASSTFIGRINFGSATFGGSEDTSGPGGNILDVMAMTNTSSTIVVDISNFNSSPKYYSAVGMSGIDVSGYGTSTDYRGFYTRNSQINNIHFVLDSPRTFSSGTTLYLYGSAD